MASMKRLHIFTLIITALLSASHGIAQQSTDLIPEGAISVVSLNNVYLLQKISLDELVRYDFMEELQQELFDGSTSGKTLKESGIDFDQRINIFQGWNQEYTIAGFSFGIDDQYTLFETFDDYEPIESSYPDVQIFASYFNRIAIKGNAAVLFRVNPDIQVVRDITDSIWFASGNDYPWYEMLIEESGYEKHSFWNDLHSEEPIDPFDTPEHSDFPIAEEDPTQKTYYELLDSIQTSLHGIWLDEMVRELFGEQRNLVRSSPQFASQLNNPSEGIFYFDNTRNIDMQQSMGSMGYLEPSFYQKLRSLYDDNMILGDLTIQDQSVNLELEVRYNEKLGSIYTELTDAKFNTRVLKYIHKDNNAYLTCNLNSEKAYQQAFEVIVPMFSGSEDDFGLLALSWEILDEFVNKKALFSTAPGSAFVTYGGIQQVKTRKIVFELDEETYRYTEKEEEAEENMPVFALGVTTDRSDLAEKVMKRLIGGPSGLIEHEDYWEVPNAIFEAAPLYFLSKNGLFIVTNDQNLVTENADGYGKNALSKKSAKRAMKSSAVYSYINTGATADNLPKGLFSDQENEVIDVMRGKPGTMEITSSETLETSTNFNITYRYEGDDAQATAYVLDLINSLYVITK